MEGRPEFQEREEGWVRVGRGGLELGWLEFMEFDYQNNI